MLWLPAAERDPRGRSLAFTETTDPKGCLHTTEGAGWPSYNGWKVHPHLTVMPITGWGVRVKQHIPFNRAGFALRNLPGGVQTNTDYVFQIELIGTCYSGGPGYRWYAADDAVLLDLGRKVVLPMSKSLGIPLKALRFQAYDASYGARGVTNTVRLSGTAFDNYSGWLGHQHVPENVHGDPGSFPWDRMIRLIQGDDMATPEEIAAAVHNADVIPNMIGDAKANPYFSSKNTAASTLKAATDALNAANAAVRAAQAAATSAGQAAATATRIEAAIKNLSLGAGAAADPAVFAKAVNDELHKRTQG